MVNTLLDFVSDPAYSPRPVPIIFMYLVRPTFWVSERGLLPREMFYVHSTEDRTPRTPFGCRCLSLTAIGTCYL